MLKMENETEDRELTARILSGETTAFKTLVNLYQDQVLNTCYRFVLNREDAEDISQDVFVEVYRSISQFEGKSRLSTWIYRITVNKSLDFMRKERRKMRSSLMKSSLDSGVERKLIINDSRQDPEQSLRQAEDLIILRDAVNRLPENQQIAFTLSKYDEISNREIADVMGTTVSSVESLIHRAKLNLRKKLYEYFEKDLKNRRNFFMIIAILLLAGALPIALNLKKIRIIYNSPQVSNYDDVEADRVNSVKSTFNKRENDKQDRI